MLNVIMLSVNMLSVIMLSVIVLDMLFNSYAAATARESNLAIEKHCLAHYQLCSVSFTLVVILPSVVALSHLPWP